MFQGPASICDTYKQTAHCFAFLYFIETDEEHINFNFQLRFTTSSVSFSSLIFKHYKLFVERNETVCPGPI